ncbi:MAG: alpha/beta fold hydrolase [Acidobacteria bacterium]|nr:alpha/beta fold hydrolase [Acidobacteriota bacterium]
MKGEGREDKAGPEPLRAPWWARGGHVQTLAAHLLKSPPALIPWERLTLGLADGDALRIRLARGSSHRVVYLFHGLGGDADRDYMARAATAFHRAGDSVVAVNHRGAGEGRGAALRPYHSGAVGDLAAVFEMGRGHFPDHRHLAIGYSLSGNILLLLLGQDGEGGLAKPDAAIAVNPPADLEACSLRLARGLCRLYDLRFVRLLRAELKARAEAGQLPFPVRLPRGSTLRDFDEAYTARAAGFRDRADYYERCSCGPHLAGIRVPTVVLSAEDDPIAPASELRAFPMSSAVRLHAEPRGGHCGYLDRDAPGRRWLEGALAHFADELLPGRA